MSKKKPPTCFYCGVHNDPNHASKCPHAPKPVPSKTIDEEQKHEDNLIAKYPEIYGVMRLQIIYARGNIRPKDEFVIPMLEAVDKLISQEVLKGQINELENLWTSGDSLHADIRVDYEKGLTVHERIRELKDLLKKEE